MNSVRALPGPIIWLLAGLVILPGQFVTPAGLGMLGRGMFGLGTAGSGLAGSGAAGLAGYELGVLAAFGLAGVIVMAVARMLALPVGLPGLHDAPPGGRSRPAWRLFIRFRDPDTAGRPRPRAPSESHALV
ncbi:DUF6412 domain-containing protein [Sphaerimonospora thailandensis]|uniref:Uncharacterized protein n=1 Tax=Sphaerimonospora thailandensis TaxID=795644 RepID=A0A8J3REN9_9ACTN|nr:DUF6412 domain-containing protein [Sphaerimonospora thailandensis]GIH73345.1 hypothetical protein Mth01_55980 [Sphaerimonospora thailandensis]